MKSKKASTILILITTIAVVVFAISYSTMSLSKHNNKVLQAKKEQEYRIYYQDSVKFINDSATIMNFSKLNEDTIRIALIYYENILKNKVTTQV
jgi:flagellar basal body-associated protein FliL